MLPYLLNEDNKSSLLVGDSRVASSANKGGEIIYTPDDFDDFDDEDPDDDLDIWVEGGKSWKERYKVLLFVRHQ